MSVPSLVASSYTSIKDRKQDLTEVREQLSAIINALPTQVHPCERESYIDSILADLNPQRDATWTSWPSDVSLLALTALKFLCRNPVGSETLLKPLHLYTLMYHSCLPTDPVNFTFLPQTSLPSSEESREALKVLANLLVLHETARARVFKIGGALAIGRALRLALIDGEGSQDTSIYAECLFLLGRIGFLVSVERSAAVKQMVDADVIDSLAQIYMTLHVVPANYMALSELLKLTNAIIRYYPYLKGASDEDDPWDEKLDPLLYPLLRVFYDIPSLDIAPPLTHTIHALVAIPFIHRLLPTWSCVPDTHLNVQNSPSSPSLTMRSLLTKLGNMASPSSPRKQSPGSLGPPRSSSPGLAGSGSQSSSPRASISSNRAIGSGLSSDTDHAALPGRLLKALDRSFETYLPYPKKPDHELPQGLVLDEILPPVLLLLTKAATSSPGMRGWLKQTLLPSNIDRSPAAGPLESRRGILGNILRLMGCASHTQTRTTAGEFMWAVCNGDPSDLCVEIGYGNAAGILFQRGLSGPPPAKIEAVPESDYTPSHRPNSSHPAFLTSQSLSQPHDAYSPINIQPATPTVSSSAAFDTERHPITGLANEQDDRSLDEMSQEEKEREAERLFVLFDRLEKNPVISMKTGDQSKGEESKDVRLRDVMRENLEKGNVDEWDRKEQEEDRRMLEEEERKDEEEAIRELQAYKLRTGKR